MSKWGPCDMLAMLKSNLVALSWKAKYIQGWHLVALLFSGIFECSLSGDCPQEDIPKMTII